MSSDTTYQLACCEVYKCRPEVPICCEPKKIIVCQEMWDDTICRRVNGFLYKAAHFTAKQKYANKRCCRKIGCGTCRRNCVKTYCLSIRNPNTCEPQYFCGSYHPCYNFCPNREV